MDDGDELRRHIDRARADVAAVEHRWGAVVDVHLNPQDLASVDAFIARECPGTPRDVLLEALIRHVLVVGMIRHVSEGRDPVLG